MVKYCALAVFLATYSAVASHYPKNTYIPEIFVWSQDKTAAVVKDGDIEIPITGGDFYPLPLILGRLRITRPEMAHWKNKKVLSLGEGYSDLVLYLRKKEVSAFALDVWYGVPTEKFPNNLVGNKMKKFIEKNKEVLVGAKCQEVPFHDQEFDLVVSHQLFNNLQPDTALTCLKEAVRVTKVGGEIRLACVTPSVEKYADPAELRKIFGTTISFDIDETKRQRWPAYYGQTQGLAKQKCSSLKITKLKANL